MKSRRVLLVGWDAADWKVINPLMDAGKMPSAPVTACAVEWNGAWVIPSGEVRPGVRSPDVWSFEPVKRE